jgi:hypothetical protein
LQPFASQHLAGSVSGSAGGSRSGSTITATAPADSKFAENASVDGTCTTNARRADGRATVRLPPGATRLLRAASPVFLSADRQTFARGGDWVAVRLATAPSRRPKKHKAMYQPVEHVDCCPPSELQLAKCRLHTQHPFEVGASMRIRSSLLRSTKDSDWNGAPMASQPMLPPSRMTFEKIPSPMSMVAFQSLKEHRAPFFARLNRVPRRAYRLRPSSCACQVPTIFLRCKPSQSNLCRRSPSQAKLVVLIVPPEGVARRAILWVATSWRIQHGRHSSPHSDRRTVTPDKGPSLCRRRLHQAQPRSARATSGARQGKEEPNGSATTSKIIRSYTDTQ